MEYPLGFADGVGGLVEVVEHPEHCHRTDRTSADRQRGGVRADLRFRRRGQLGREEVDDNGQPSSWKEARERPLASSDIEYRCQVFSDETFGYGLVHIAVHLDGWVATRPAAGVRVVVVPQGRHRRRLLMHDR